MFETSVLTAFTVFYAISWGALANALPRWKAFDTGRFWDSDAATRKEVRNRFYWSFLVLTVIPAAYFAIWDLVIDASAKWGITTWGLRAAAVIFAAAMAAWTPLFAFYRFWVSLVAFKLAWFYPKKLHEAANEDEWKKRFPNLHRDDLNPAYVMGNFCFAWIYLLLSVIFSVVVVCLS